MDPTMDVNHTPPPYRLDVGPAVDRSTFGHDRPRPATSGGNDMMWDGRPMWDGVPAVFMWAWMVFGLLVLVLVVAAIVWLVRSMGSSDARSWSRSDRSGSPREELDRRYARGEITREEYRQLRDDLEGPGG